MGRLVSGAGERAIETVFDLLGTGEDDLTRATAWGLAQSEAFERRLLEFLSLPFGVGALDLIRVQHAVKTRGRTDIELVSANALIIFEAKLGWNMPSIRQVETYESRIADAISEGRVTTGGLVTISECSADWAKNRLPDSGPYPRRHVRWQDMIALAESVASQVGNREKRTLRELARYLRSATTMHGDPASQMTWVVPITSATPSGSRCNFIETVESGWYYNKSKRVPKVPFNFIGFRWHSALREIRLVKSRRPFDDPHDALPDLFPAPASWEEHELFELGPAIRPQTPVPYGPIRADGYHRALLDCLLTCSSVADARDVSKDRFAEAGISF